MHRFTRYAIERKYPLDAGCPEPVAEGEIEPVDWDVCENVYQARQKLEHIDRAIRAEKAACGKRVGPVNSSCTNDQLSYVSPMRNSVK